MDNAGNFTFDWCLTFVEVLVSNGLRHVVISPGSRSTPLTLAFAAHPDIKKTVVLDERSAAFIALGMGKITGSPAALVCTSGTAAANYYPAVVEASMAGVPLLVLTTDRPPNLRHIGASQAIDQLKMFGDYPRMFFETGEPVNSNRDLRRLRHLALQAYDKSVDNKGPVHINFAFRKPLEPDPVHYRAHVDRLAQSGETQIAKPQVGRKASPVTDFPEWLIERIKQAERPVVVAGEAAAGSDSKSIVMLARRLGAPLLAEAPAQLAAYKTMEPSPFICGFDAFLKDERIRKDLDADLILRFGGMTISKGLNLWLKSCKGTDQIVLSTSAGAYDPALTAGYFVTIPSYELNIDTIPTGNRSAWLNKWMQLSDRHRNHVPKMLEGTSSLTDGEVEHEISGAIPHDWLVMLSNSFPVRDFDLFGYQYHGNGPVLVNRGASGIDGVTSTFIGAAMASGKNGILVTGDLAFLHDTNALLTARKISEHQTLIVFVINNNGGGIFRMLPISYHKEVFSTYFETSQEVDFRSLSNAYGIEYQRIGNKKELRDAVRGLTGKKGFHIMECVTDSEESMNLRLRLSR